MTTYAAMAAALFLCVCAAVQTGSNSPRKILVAHRGASAYAPEHTLEAYGSPSSRGPTSWSRIFKSAKTACSYACTT